MLAQSPNVDGYPVVYLSRKGKNCCVRVHRLLAKTFIEQPEGCNIVNHIDGDKTNYSLDNLEWTTVQGNVDHAINVLGKKNLPSLTINEQIAKSICEDLESGVSQKDIQSKYAVSQSIVSKIATRSAWEDVSKDYSFNKRVGKIVISDLHEIISLLNKGMIVKEVVSYLDKSHITVDTVSRISSGKTYKQITIHILKSKEERSQTRALARTSKRMEMVGP